jgi:hypothetical protein
MVVEASNHLEKGHAGDARGLAAIPASARFGISLPP